tara:strand:- start:328 stop:906 length:579 start_codon:yes stop_codon:yes gene_type:complete
MTEWSIDAKSMASVKRQVDKISVAGLNVQQVFATIGTRLAREVRKELNSEIALKNASSTTPIAGSGGLLSVTVKPTGRARFTVEIKGNTVKGKVLMGGRKGGGFIRPKRKKSMMIEGGGPGHKPRNPSHKFTGKITKRVRKVSVAGRSDEVQRVADEVVRSQVRHQIKTRTGLGEMGGGSVRRGRGGKVRLK